jgi:5-methylcytosine-specific restriction endonuclease McrA
MTNIAETNEWLRRYKAYLQSPEWQEKRERLLEFWDYQCATCSSPLDLQVHHRTYKRVGNERLNDLIVLCESCHEKFHETLGKQAGPDRPQTVQEIVKLWEGMNFDGIKR